MSSRECDSPRPTVISKHCVRDPTLAECTLGAAAESRVLTPCPPLHDVESRRSFAPAAPSATGALRLRKSRSYATAPPWMLSALAAACEAPSATTAYATPTCGHTSYRTDGPRRRR